MINKTDQLQTLMSWWGVGGWRCFTEQQIKKKKC